MCHFVSFTFGGSQNSSQYFAIEGKLFLFLFSEVAPVIPLILAQVGDVAFVSRQSCMGIRAVQLNNVLGCEVVDARSPFNTIVLKD
jgi:hypothetical protein